MQRLSDRVIFRVNLRMGRPLQSDDTLDLFAPQDARFSRIPAADGLQFLTEASCGLDILVAELLTRLNVSVLMKLIETGHDDHVRLVAQVHAGLLHSSVRVRFIPCDMTVLSIQSLRLGQAGIVESRAYRKDPQAFARFDFTKFMVAGIPQRFAFFGISDL